MKSFSKILKTVLCGLLTVIFIYPFLHEAGHVIAAKILGAKVMETSLFPNAYTVIETARLGKSRIAFIAFFGSVFPLITTFLSRKRRYCSFYISFLIRLIVLADSLISIAAVMFGATEGYDVLYIMCGRGISVVIFAVLFTVALISILRDRPLKRFRELLL